MAKEEIGIGIVGTGHIAQIAYLPALKKVEGAKILALCDSETAKARSLAEKHGIPRWTTRFEDLLQMEEVKGIVITTPNYLHHPMVLASLEFGKHVLCEKPIALDRKSVEDLVNLSKKTKSILMPANNFRYRPDAQALKKFVEKGELGEIFYIKTGWLQRMEDEPVSGWRREKRQAGGGVLLTYGIHILDLALWFLEKKEVLSVNASMHFPSREKGVENGAFVFLKLEGDTTLTLEISWTLLDERDFTYLNLFGSKGGALLQPLRIQKELHGHLVNVTPKIESSLVGRNPYKASFELQTEHFVQSIHKGKESFPFGEDEVRLAQVIEAAYLSVKNREEVKIVQ